MKKQVIITLACINVVLLLALVLLPPTPPAYAQVGVGDYMMLTGRAAGGDVDAVYVIDLGKRRLAALRYDRNRKRVLPAAGRDLLKDFRP